MSRSAAGMFSLGRQFLLGVGVAATLGCLGGPASPLPPGEMVKHAGDSATFTYGTAARLYPSVRVTGPGESPLAGVTVTFEATEGTLDASVATTNSDGLATAPGWSPAFVGINRLRASASGYEPIEFLATGVCVPTGTIALGDRISGLFEPTDCHYSVATCYYACSAYRHDRFAFTLASAQTVRIEGQTNGKLDVAIFDAESRSLGFHQYLPTTAAQPSPYRWALLPAGSYVIEALDVFFGGGYLLGVSASTENLGCRTPLIARGVTATQSLAHLDCVRDENGARFVDAFNVTVHVGQSVTVTMSSGDFDTYLEIEKIEPAGIPPRKLAQNGGGQGVPARIVQTCNEEMATRQLEVRDPVCMFRILATSKLALASGNYVLAVR